MAVWKWFAGIKLRKLVLLNSRWTQFSLFGLDWFSSKEIQKNVAEPELSNKLHTYTLIFSFLSFQAQKQQKTKFPELASFISQNRNFFQEK